jgi:pimeloyl-ACP methyl ester carboxylesterase
VDDCSRWPRGELPAGYFEPPAGSAPVLVLQGWLDPVTPPSWAHELREHLPNARVLVIREGHHSFAFGECGRRLMADFYDRIDPQGLDAGCAVRIRRPPFQTGTGDEGS